MNDTEKLYTLEEVKTIAVQSYELGGLQYPAVRYDMWLESKLYKHGTDKSKDKNKH
jgi:hypothetical protein